MADGGATRVKIAAAWGGLTVRGLADLQHVHVHGEAHATSQESLEKIELIAEKRGSEILVRAQIPASRSLGRVGLDVEIDMPKALGLEVDHGSGGLDIRGAATVRRKDGSGDIGVAEVAGDVQARDESGALEVRAVGSAVTLGDGSGEFSVKADGGDVTVTDGSGEVRIQRVAGDVTIKSDESGDIEVREVDSSLTIERDGGGSLRLEQIRGAIFTHQ